MIHTRYNQGSLTRMGSGIPMYDDEDFIPQRRADMKRVYYSTWLCPQTAGIPFQVSVMGEGFVSAVMGVYTASTGTSYIGAGWNALLDVQCFTGGVLITYDGSAFPATIDSKAYYYGLIVTFDETEVSLASDEFMACTTQADDAYLLSWWDSKDWLGGVFYGDGYKNKMWLRTDMARPKVEYVEEVVQNGYGLDIPVYQRSQDIYSFDVPACDSQVGVLYRIAHHDNVTLKHPDNATASTISSVRASDTGEKADAVAVVEVSFKVDLMESTTLDFAPVELGAC